MHKVIISCKGLLMSSLQTNICPNVSPHFLVTLLWEEFGTSCQHTGHICTLSHLQYLNHFHRTDEDVTLSKQLDNVLIFICTIFFVLQSVFLFF